MKTSLLIVLASLSAACSGAPFTVAEMADMAQSPDAGGHLAEPDTAELPDAGPAGQPDAGPATGQPDANPAQAVLVAVDAATVAPDSGTVQPQPDAGNAEPDADTIQLDVGTPAADGGVLQPDAQPSTPVVLCTTANTGVFLLTPTSLDFGPVPVGTTSTKSMSLTDLGGCSATVDTAGSPSRGEFQVGAAGCTSLSPGQSCSIMVTFAPGQAGGNATYSGSVSVLGVEYDYTAVGRGE